MKTFLITFKPRSESPRGWPISELQKLVRKHEAGKRVVEPWRFLNRKDVSIGDRVFVLQQGKLGPAIIGYGAVASNPERDEDGWFLKVRLDSIVDPSTHVLVEREELLSECGPQQAWRTQASGIKLKESLARELETLVIGRSPRLRTEGSRANPDWTRDELIVALDFYLARRPNPPRKGSREIRELSNLLNRLGEKLFSRGDRADTFRNENSVYMKLMNFRRLDPEYTADGKTGLRRGAKADEEVWEMFGRDPRRCHEIAQAIVAVINDTESNESLGPAGVDDGMQDAPEGRLLTRIHVVRERSRKLVESKRKQAIQRFGKLACEACGFDFAVHYGAHGKEFIECHHTKPVFTLSPGDKTHLDDLALVCSNCHRMIHRREPWLSIAGLRKLIEQARLVEANHPPARIHSRS